MMSRASCRCFAFFDEGFPGGTSSCRCDIGRLRRPSANVNLISSLDDPFQGRVFTTDDNSSAVRTFGYQSSLVVSQYELTEESESLQKGP